MNAERFAPRGRAGGIGYVRKLPFCLVFGGRVVTAGRRTQAVVLSLIVVLAPNAARAAGPASWGHPGYDAEDSYYNPSESVVNAGTIGHLTRRWSVHLRTRDETCTHFSAPLVAAGRVIATDEPGISAYNAVTGAPAWNYTWTDPGDTVTPQLAADGGTLIAATSGCQSQSDPNGQVVALDLATGHTRWRADLEAPVVTLAVDKGIAVVSGVSPSD